MRTELAKAKAYVRQHIIAGTHATLERHPVLRGRLLFLLPHILDHALTSQPRYGYGKPPHGELERLFRSNGQAYAGLLRSFLAHSDRLARIPQESGATSAAALTPSWRNWYFTGPDAVALYSFLAEGNPRRYFEIGSGNSTLFARRAIVDNGLRTTITSFDPQPRVGIDELCDRVERVGVEAIPPERFAELEEGDILFVDNSHRVFMNSDACVVFLDILPKLRPGVLVHIHDIFLPNDYPPWWVERFYSEQYLLAAMLLADSRRFETVLPNHFVSQDAKLRGLLEPLWNMPSLSGVDKILMPTSFWLKTT